MVLRLKDFIKKIRACKTAAEERALIARESASIRTALKDSVSSSHRHHHVAKLLYMYMLGYPAHFGQMECVKLVASSRFADKRLGYLGIMLLLDEHSETLTLVTNSLKNDLNHPNMYVVGMALVTLANVASEAMARDLAPEVEKLLGSSNSLIRKKAALCAVRVLKRAPDLHDIFMPRARSLLSERNHGALLAGLSLLELLCAQQPSTLTEFRKAVPSLVKALKQLITTGYSPEHDVSGITDPFLQVKLLRVLRLLGAGDATATEAMADVLAQVATTMDGSKNVGNAVLYETVRTVLAIDADSTLRVLAINILGRFLAHKDNNVRYAALTTLLATVQVDGNAVLRHRTTVLECLRDPDVSIRRRALELASALTVASNVRIMVRELLAFLDDADADLRPTVVAHICTAADKYAPNQRWHLDTLVRVMKVAGAHVRDETVAQFVRLVTNAPELQAYVVRKLYALLKTDHSQAGLVRAGIWVIGEYGDLLVQPGAAPAPDDAEDDDNGTTDALRSVALDEDGPNEAEVVALLERVLSAANSTVVTQLAITALMKLAARFHEPAVVQAIQALLARYQTSMVLELQQRSVEYLHMFNLDPELRRGLWECMPVMDLAPGEKGKYAARAVAGPGPTITAAAAAAPSDPMSLLMDLAMPADAASAAPAGGLPLLESLGTTTAPAPRTTSGAPVVADLMADLLAMSGVAPAAEPKMGAAKAVVDPLDLLMGGPVPAIPSMPTGGNTMDLLGSGPAASASPATAPATATPPALFADLAHTVMAPAVRRASLHTGPLVPSAASTGPSIGGYDVPHLAYESAHLLVHLTPTSASPGIIQVNATLAHRGGVNVPVTDLQLLVAVPKSLKLQMGPLSATRLGVGEVGAQTFRIANPSKASPVKLRLKVVYACAGEGVEKVVDFRFPESVV
ncbi:clathrin associated protein complex large subunit [Allomyces javanicus]|nr:clathrin associated protein complex large subunit [Allomyces javanicus]